MIVVTGATGNVGSSVVRSLLERGEKVRAFVRDPEKARRMLGEDVELSIGDFNDVRSVADALSGGERVFLSSGEGPGKVPFEKAVIDAAVEAGVGLVVRASTIGADDASFGSLAWHGELDEALKDLHRDALSRPRRDGPESRQSHQGACLASNRTEREAMVLVEWLGMGQDEAATTLGIKPGSPRRARRAILVRFPRWPSPPSSCRLLPHGRKTRSYRPNAASAPEVDRGPHRSVESDHEVRAAGGICQRGLAGGASVFSCAAEHGERVDTGAVRVESLDREVAVGELEDGRAPVQTPGPFDRVVGDRVHDDALEVATTHSARL